MNFLDGKKRWIVAIVVAIAGVVKMVTGYDLTSWVAILFTSIGWGGETGTPLADILTNLAMTLVASWASIDALLKFLREKKAGASTAEALTPTGGVKLAIAEGRIAPVEIVPSAEAVPLAPARLEAIKAVNKDVDKRAA